MMAKSVNLPQRASCPIIATSIDISFGLTIESANFKKQLILNTGTYKCKCLLLENEHYMDIKINEIP